MTGKNDSGYRRAFPVTAGNMVFGTGMSLRDWFAGQAPITVDDACAYLGFSNRFEAMFMPDQREEVFGALAFLRGKYADAMIKALEAEADD